MPVPADISLKDALGATITANAPLDPGRAAAADSRPVVLSTEDFALLTLIGGYLDGLEGYVDGIETLIGNSNTKLDSLIAYALAQFTANDGETVGRLLSAAASTNASLVSSVAGRVKRIMGVNVNASPRYLKIYDKATTPTVGTDTPKMTIYLPANSAFDLSGFNIKMTAGIGFALTTGVADADTGAVSAGDILALNINYTL